MKQNIHLFDFKINKKMYIEKQGHNSHVFWLFGLSGSGKSTLANAASEKLFQKFSVKVIDGDTLRSGLNQDLNFTAEGRFENLRRAAEVAKLFANSGFIVISTFITPLEAHRGMIQEILGDDCSFIFVDTPLEECIRRDPKGLYKKAMQDKIPHFTGISSPFEPMKNPDLLIEMNKDTNQLELLEKFILSKVSP